MSPLVWKCAANPNPTPASAPVKCWSLSSCRSSLPVNPHSSQVGSNSVWRWRVRWRHNPKFLLLDEPLSALDLKLRKAMQLELKHLQRETGITFIFVTHDQEEALTMSDRIAVMSAGELQQLGGPKDIYEKPHNMFVADFIGETNLLEVSVDKIANNRAICHLGGGHELTCDAVEGVGVGSNVHLSVRPERLYMSDKPVESESLKGRVKENIFVGTDITTIVDLDDGPDFVVRTSNSERGNKRIFEPGAEMFVNMELGAARLLID